MAVKVAEGVVEIVGDATSVPRDVARDVAKGANSPAVNAAGVGLGKRIFGGVLAGWAAIGGINAVIGFFTGAVSGASNLNETMSASKQIFGEGAAAIDQWGTTAWRSVGLSKQAAVDAAVGFGNMFTQLGWTSAAAADLSTKTVQVAADLGSFRNLPTADVADRISAALRGEYDSLQVLIPNINAARVEKEALAMTGKALTAELTAQEKAAATLAIIERDGAAAMGDFARTSDGAANSAKIVSAQFADQQSVLGQQLLPVWTGFLGFLSTTVIPVFTDVVKWIGENSETMLMLGIVVGGTALAFSIATVAGTAYKAYQIAAAATTGGLTVAQWALNAAMTANPIGIIIVAIGALVAAIVWIATQTTWFQDIWATVTGAIGAAMTWLWETVLNPVITAIGAGWDWLYNTIILPVMTGVMIYVGIWAAIFTWLWETVLSPIFGLIGAVFGWLWDTIIMPIVNYIVLGVQAWGAIFTWLWENAINPALQAVAGGFSWVWNTIISPVVGFITGAITTVGTTVSSVFGGIAGFIGSAFTNVLAVIKAPINAIIGLINGAIDGVNSIRIEIPGWVPIVGGQVFSPNIPRIPMLARGSLYAPDMFIAGERGPELITGARGSRVYSNTETRDMLAHGGGGITIGSITIQADTIEDFMRIIKIIKALPQVARAGRGAPARG